MRRWIIGFIFGLSLPCLGATYQVGPERPYKSLQEVAGLLNPGDEVLVDGGATYPGGLVFTRPGTAEAPIRIRGNRAGEARPILSGGTNTVTFATPWPYDAGGADHYIFEGFEVSDGSFRGIFHQADDLTLRDVVVRDCPAHGILGADEGSGSLLMEQCEVARCGSGDSRHQIYMATDEVNHPGSVFRMQNCFVHDGNGGNNIKSRAERNEIYYNWIEGAYYHELELIGPDGGDGGNPALKREDSDVVGNVLMKRATSAGNDPNFSVTRVGGDGTGETDGRYRFVNNTILCGTGSVFRIFDGIESIEMHNNILAPIGAGPVKVKRTAEADWSTGQEVIAGSNNWVATGSEEVPTQWTGTLLGTAPGFEGASLRPAQESPLRDAANAAPQSPPGFPFPTPLFPPAFEPPVGTPPEPSAVRPTDGALDIGAYEGLSTDPHPVIHLFSADPHIVVQGEASQLIWSVTGATELLFYPGGHDVTGTSGVTVIPPITTAYSLVAAGPGGSTSASVVVTVSVLTVCVDDDNWTGEEDGTALHPFRTVQAALDAAIGEQVVRVAVGTYLGNSALANKHVFLFGGYAGGTAGSYEAGIPGAFSIPGTDPNATHLIGDGSGPVLRYTGEGGGGTTYVEGFRITGGERGILMDGDDSAVITSCTIEDNGPETPDPSFFGGGICALGSSLDIIGNSIRNNRAGLGAGVGLSSCVGMFDDNLIEGNIGFGDHGGGLWLGGTGMLSGNIIRGNRIGEAVGYGWGGGILMVGEFIFRGNTVVENQAPTLGGGVFVDEGADVRIEGCVIAKNRTLEEWVKGGAGIYVDGAWDGTPSSAVIQDCTVADNTSPGTVGGNGIFVEFSSAVVRDSIFWGNSGGDDFYVDSAPGSSLDVAYTLSGELWPGVGNLTADPLFADATAGNYRLRSKAGRWDDFGEVWVTDAQHSPAIDAASPSSAWEQEPIPNGGRRNLGYDGNTAFASKSYSSPVDLPGDCDGDGSVSIGEVQRAVNMFLGLEAPACGVDCSGDGSVSIGEVQKVINGFLGLPSSC